MTVLSYFELSDEDQPPQRIWLDPEALAGHFENVRARRRQSSGTDEPQWEDIDSVVDNDDEEVRRLRSGR